MSVKLPLGTLERIAREHGYADYRSMLYECYVVQGMSLVELARRLHIHHNRLKRHLTRFGIPIRKRGGRNHLKIEVTAELLEETIRDGIPAVALRLGVTQSALHARIHRAYDQLKKTLLSKQDP